ncbi:hypothetical protein [Acidipropionibacterium jensenii]|uniref:Glycosyltransferase RgtA/B/C/D-like domain-containing protein n=1 Tax=Acidipropionibacterium jensenii TaxID=1749 RepID=A0A448P2Y8_9ACTN|nr:hypothetical protein [Acidipropionibacterium jensenii]MDN5976734.1 hypothetical protein [Acidipropionibacterium jensenii]MDN5995115.1 hypothetical protein [Acidipropionibacterium jensenii]MDN6020697.1 hypothetical protein [Acidipropionibacterium jensenii]MDN6426733.1 hypothetical protein [Acidipropionibacterium jensenii]MDN6441860.1 hypothetical protein [Acidipropionibacterium jensenii]
MTHNKTAVWWRVVWRYILKVLATLLATIVGCTVLLAIGFAIPNGRIINQVVAQSRSGLNSASYQPNGLSNRTDTFTETIGYCIGVLPAHSQMPLWKRVSMVPRCTGGPQVAVMMGHFKRHPNELTGGASPYIRYWSGFSVVSRPALALGGVYMARVVSLLCLVAAVFYLAVMLAKRAGLWAAIGLIGVYLGTTDLLALTSQFTHALAQATILATGAMMLQFGRKWQTVGYLAVVSGGLFAFMDLLTNPPASCALTVAMAGLVGWTGSRRIRTTLVFLASSTLGWLVGFVGTWVARWIEAMPYNGGRTTVSNVRNTAKFRLDGDVSSTGRHYAVNLEPGATTMTNFRMWLSYPLSQYVLTMVIVLALVIIAWLLLRDRHSLVGMLVLLIPVLYVPGYLEIMRSHSQIHSWFVFRDVAMGFAVTAAVCLHFLEEKVRPHAVPVVLRVRDDPAGIRTTEGSDDMNGAARPSMS